MSGQQLDVVADVILYKNGQKEQIIEAENAEEEQTPQVACMSANAENALNEENLLKDTTANADKDTERKKWYKRDISPRERRNNLHRMEQQKEWWRLSENYVYGLRSS